MIGGEIVADIPAPGACQACGRALPPQEFLRRRVRAVDAYTATRDAGAPHGANEHAKNMS